MEGFEITSGDAISAAIDQLLSAPTLPPLPPHDPTLEASSSVICAGHDGRREVPGLSIDLLINNAGYHGPDERTEVSGTDTGHAARTGTASEPEVRDGLDFTALSSHLDANAVGPLRVCMALLPHMTAPGGKIVNISTQVGYCDLYVDLYRTI